MGGKSQSPQTLTRGDLEHAVWQAVGLSRVESSRLVGAILETITQGVLVDGVVKLSSFGTFLVRQKAARQGRNPRTGEAVLIAKRRVLTFRPSPVLKSRIADSA